MTGATSNPLRSVRLNAAVFAARAEHDGPDLEQAIADTEPDAVVVDINSWGALTSRRGVGRAVGDLLPVPAGAALEGRAAVWARVGAGARAARSPVATGCCVRSCSGPSNVSCGRCSTACARALGLAPVSTVAEGFEHPALILYMTAEPFEYPRRDWPANVVMVGPCAWDPPAEPPPWLEHAKTPIVLVNTSTEFQNDGRLVEVALQALAGEPVTVVATLPAGDPSRLQIPANAHVERFIPHTPVLERAACAVTHGGMGSTQKALAHGVPVCAVPFGRDQLEVARRVEVARAGTRLPLRRLRPDRLRAKITEAMGLADGARRIAAAYAATGGAGTAADAVETRLLRRAAAAAGA